MPDFRYLGEQGFPHAQNVDVYKYDNELDYKRYDYSQMTVTMCNVPWEQGEAHVGQRTLSGIGNVVYFGSEKERDEWFDSIPDNECFRWETKFKELHSDLEINVPLPFDVASNYNYVRVEYNLFANDNSKLQYEDESGTRTWFYFIREAQFIAPNTTKLTLLEDAWQTWIYKLEISSMILERGHAPMFDVKADDYLKNPIGSCANLLAEDVNYGELQKVTETQATTLNAGDTYACIATTSIPWYVDEWGSKDKDDWKVPAGAHYTYTGAPNVAIIAMDSESLNDFLDAVTEDIPQFKQTVQGVFFVAKELVSVDTPVTFAKTKIYRVHTFNKIDKNVFSQSKESWGYPSRYADIAKLYTYPYSALEITDGDGNTELVKIEDTTGKLTMSMSANLIFPYLKLQGVIKGVGGSSGGSVKFKNVSEHTFAFSGRWYDHVREWDVPTFAVVLSPLKEYDYSSHFNRIQMKNDYELAKKIADANADVAKENTETSATASENATIEQADATQTVSFNNADNAVDSATVQTATNNTLNAKGNSISEYDAWLMNEYGYACQRWDAGLTNDTKNIEIAEKDATTSVSVAAANARAVPNIVASILNSNYGDAIAGIATQGLDSATTLQTNAIAMNSSESQAVAVNRNSLSKLVETNQSNADRTSNANKGKTQQTAVSNECFTTTSLNAAAVAKENAYTTTEAAYKAAGYIKQAAYDNAKNSNDQAHDNATDTENNEIERVKNQKLQAHLNAPEMFGSVNNAESAVNKPQALYVNVVTESDYAIQKAGDEFLRYGYYLGKQYDFTGDWRVGRHFTFWQLRDYWSNTQIPDRYGDAIRFLLFGGVTVWSNPEDIGSVSIYDNYV